MKKIYILTIFSVIFSCCDTKNVTTVENVRDLNKEIAKNITIQVDSFDLLVLKQSVREICSTNIDDQPTIDYSKDFNPDIDSNYFKEIVTNENGHKPVIFFNRQKNNTYLDSTIRTFNFVNKNSKIIEFTIGGRIINKDTVSISDFFLYDTSLYQTTRIYTLSNNVWTSRVIKQGKVELRRANSH